MNFAQSWFAQFIAGPSGRLLRIVAGVVLILAGLFWIGDALGWIIAAIGLVPIAAGVFDVCLLSPLFSGPFSGEGIRHARRTR